MDKDEMKNRISMALKDPILQQGFEIICKENEELKKDYEETEELLDKQIEETYKLFEENAKLKKRCANYEMQISKMEKGACDVCKETEKDEQLIKAKELLREIIDTPVFNQMGCDLYENEGYTELVKEAEQFLKED